MAATLPASVFAAPQPEPLRGEPARHVPRGPWADRAFAAAALAAACLTLALLAGIIVALVVGAAPAIERFGLAFLVRAQWDPVHQRFGGLVMIYGTLMSSLIALLIAVPVSFGIA